MIAVGRLEVVCAVIFVDCNIVLLCCSTSIWTDVAVFLVVARIVVGTFERVFGIDWGAFGCAVVIIFPNIVALLLSSICS